jgi:hypothetical protein
VEGIKTTWPEGSQEAALEAVEVGSTLRTEEVEEGSKTSYSGEEEEVGSEDVEVLLRILISMKINNFLQSSNVSLSHLNQRRFKLKKNVQKSSYGFNKEEKIGQPRQELTKRLSKLKIKLISDSKTNQ